MFPSGSVKENSQYIHNVPGHVTGVSPDFSHGFDSWTVSICLACLQDFISCVPTTRDHLPDIRDGSRSDSDVPSLLILPSTPPPRLFLSSVHQDDLPDCPAGVLKSSFLLIPFISPFESTFFLSAESRSCDFPFWVDIFPQSCRDSHLLPFGPPSL